MSSFGKMYIYVDDTRTAINAPIPDGMAFCEVKTYKEAIKTLEFYMQQGSTVLVDLDHDLGCKKTGYDIAKWIVNTGYQKLRFHIHSANVVGVNNIRSLLTHYGYKEF